MKSQVKHYFVLSFLVLVLVTSLYGDVTPIGPITFGKGLQLDRLPTLIADDGSPDLCNCSPEIIGALSKRNGSRRFISHAISSNPITSLRRFYSSPVSSQTLKVTFAASGDKVFISTFDVNPQWVVISSNNVHNQHYNFVAMNGQVIIAGDALTENTKRYAIATGSFTDAFFVGAATGGINPRGKHQIVVNNYYILANVAISTERAHLPDNTTYYSSRLLYGGSNNFSSMTIQRFIDFNQNDGEEITAIGTLYGGSALPGGGFRSIVNIFKPSSIGELSFTVLDNPSQGGDWNLSEIARGVGVLAPRAFVNTREFYAFLDRSGILLWNRDGYKNISGKIRPLIDDLIRTGKYKSAVMTYYPKKEWLVLSIEHPFRFPKGKNNYVLVFDLRTEEWWPFCGWLADSIMVTDNNLDNGQIYYGDSADGYVHEVDVEATDFRDSRKELVLDVMDSSFTWSGSSHDAVNVREGTASLKISIYGTPTSASPVLITSMTKMGIYPLGEWYDKTRATLNDKISFDAFISSSNVIRNLRIDLEVKSVTGTFDTNFTSVTISSDAFGRRLTSNNGWIKFEIPLSSFPVRPDWTDLSIESVAFYNRFNAYGIRFVVSGLNLSSVSIDNLRFVSVDTPVKNHRFTKLFDFQTSAFKGFGTVLLTMDRAHDATYFMDIYNDFGQKIRTEVIGAEVPKEILTFGWGNNPGLAILDSRDFTVKRQTQTVITHWDCFNGAMDDKQITCGDRINDRLLSFSRTDLSTFTNVYGSFGTGTSNFNLIHEIAQYSGGYLISDLTNQRTKVHSTKNLGFLKQYGQLGTGNTSYHQPTGVAADDSHYFVSDESNDRLLKLHQSTFGIVAQVSVDHNTNADSSLAAGDKSVFMLYNRTSAERDDTLECILEKRDKGNLDVLQSVSVRPVGVSTGSYRVQGSIGLLGRYVIVVFSNDEGQSNIVYYIQKRLQSNLEVVSEYATDQRFFSGTGYSLSYKPLTRTEQKDLKVEGRYVQIKFYDDESDNFWRLYHMTPKANIQPIMH